MEVKAIDVLDPRQIEKRYHVAPNKSLARPKEALSVSSSALLIVVLTITIQGQFVVMSPLFRFLGIT